MILFDLVCAQDHAFEGWFKSSEGFDKQVTAHGIACPVCGSTKIRQAPSAPALLKGRGDAAARAIEVRAALEKLRQQVEANADYVGDKFPDEARKIHYGETDERAIYGEATPDEAAELSEEGVPFVSIPWPTRQDS